MTAEGSDVREVTIPPSTTDKEIDLDFVYSRLKGVLVKATGVAAGTTITIKTNSTGAPGDTVTFVTPGCKFYAIDSDSGVFGENPFTADVTRLYVSNPSTDDSAAFRISALYDPTP